VSVGRTRFGRLKVHQMRRNVGCWIGLSGVFRPRLEREGIPPERFRVIPGGVDMSGFRPRGEAERRALRRALDLPEGRVAISAGTIMHRKGMDRVLAAWARLNPRAGRDLLVLIGPDWWEPAYVEEIQRRSAEPGLKGTVRLPGLVDNVGDYMGAADVFVLLSRKEGLGYVTLEAMASGLPCVISPLDGIADELIEEGRTGHVAREPDDADAVGALLDGLLRDPARRERMGAEARREAERRFSHEARAAALRAAYRAAAEEQGPRRVRG
jgi:glycosyltransferase involved in cell wall biosynthesis